MSVNIKGLDKVLAQMEKELGTKKVNRVVNKTLDATGEVLKQKVKSAVSVYKDTGATVDEVVKSKSKKIDGINKVKVGWNGPKQRSKLVHLNEFGYTRNGKRYSPRGKGVIRNTVDEAEGTYIKNMRSGLKEIIK